MDLIEIETMEAGSEEDDLPGHPDEHDDKTCEIKKCRACKLKRGWRTWCKAAASPSPFDQKISAVWAQECPKKWKRKRWALGCSLCFRRMTDTAWSGSKWAQFKIESVRDQEQIRQHRKSAEHQLSLAHHFKLDVVEMEMTTKSTGRPAKCKLVVTFGKGRPQLMDYVRIWFGNSKHQSSKHLTDESLLEQRLQMEKAGVNMKIKYSSSMRNKVRAVMFETLKRQWRRSFWNCRDAAHKCDGKQFCGESILFLNCDWGTLDTSYGAIALANKKMKTPDAKANPMSAARQLQQVFKAVVKDFCSVGKSFQYGKPGHYCEETYQRVMSSWTVSDWDGAPIVQAAGRLLAGSTDTPNVGDVSRDFTHELKIIFRDAVMGDEVAARVRQCIVIGQHSFSKQVEYSEIVAQKYQEQQREVIKEMGSQGNGLTSILKSCSYSPKDFNTEKKRNAKLLHYLDGDVVDNVRREQ